MKTIMKVVLIVLTLTALASISFAGGNIRDAGGSAGTGGI